MQGQLTHKYVSVTVNTECAHCSQPIELVVDNRLDYRDVSPGAKPVISLPLVNPARLKAPNIIDAL